MYTFHNVLGSCLGTGIVEHISSDDINKKLLGDIKNMASNRTSTSTNGEADSKISNNDSDLGVENVSVSVSF